MIKIRKVAATLAAFIVGALISLGVGVVPASAATQIGGVSVLDYCIRQYAGPVSAVVVSDNVYGWRCRYNGGWNHIDYDVDMNKQCLWQYGGGAYAKYTDFNDPYSWKCYR